MIKHTKIKKVTPLGKQKQKVFDITMESNPHTFFANDILVHNSCYFRLMGAENLKEAEEMAREVQQQVDGKSIPFLVKDIFNGHDEVLKADFETITSSTLSYGKKKQYAYLKVWNDGETLTKPKLAITGLSIKRTDSPKQLSDKMKPFFIELMGGLKHSEIKHKMDTIEKEYNGLGIYDLSAKRSANNMVKYKKVMDFEVINGITPFNVEKLEEAVAKFWEGRPIKISDEIYEHFMKTGKGKFDVEDDSNDLIKTKNGPLEVSVDRAMVIPFHIKAAIFYNFLLEEKGLDHLFTKIMDGEKIKIFYIKPVKYKYRCKDKEGNEHNMIMEFDCIAFPSGTKTLPDFLEDFKIDRRKMLTTYFEKKMETLFKVIEYNPEAVQNESANLLF